VYANVLATSMSSRPVLLLSTGSRKVILPPLEDNESAQILAEEPSAMQSNAWVSSLLVWDLMSAPTVGEL